MKKVLIVLLFCCKNVFPQGNIIYNPGFENGLPGHYPQCDYVNTHIDKDIIDWVNGNTSTGNTNRSFPDWMNASCTNKVAGLQYNSRFVYMGKLPSKNKTSDAIRTGFTTTMNNSKNYLFKITYSGVTPKSSSELNLSERVRIYFTKFNKNWNATWGNTSVSFLMYPPSYTISGWVQHWMLIPSNVLGNYFNDLHNIVIVCEQGEFYVDYVELSETCQDPLSIQYHDFFSGTNELPYKSGGTLNCGYNVGAPPPLINGNVIVHTGASILFKAASKISLQPGFIVENGANFNAIISPCDNTNPNKINNTPEDVTYTIVDDHQQTLGCNDTLKITGLDGDTVSYTSFWWDFGNGQISTKKSVKIYYTQPGTYKVKLAVIDSMGSSDTLTKIYIRPSCGKTMNENLTTNTNSFSIYPSPNTGVFVLNLSQKNTVAKDVYVIGIMGKIVFEKKQITETNLTIDLSNHPKGIYFVKIVSTDGNIEVKKVVIQ